MTRSATKWMDVLRRLSLTGQTILLPVLYLAYLAVAAPLGWLLYGGLGAAAALVAVLVCLIAGWLTLMLNSQFSPAGNPIAHLVVGMAVRTGLPLVVCLMAISQSHWLVDAGFVWFLLGAYLLGLSIETTLRLSQLDHYADRSSQESSTGT